MKQRSVIEAVVLSCVVAVGCSSSDGLEIEGEVFDEDGKADTAGIRENTFDAFAVLNAAAKLDVADLRSVTGMTLAKARRLYDAQRSPGWGGTGLPSLKALRAVGVTAPQLAKLLAYANSHDLRPSAAIKVPIMDDQNRYLTTFNGDMRNADLPLFSKYLYVWDGPAAIAQYVYFDKLDDRAYEAGVEVEMYVGAGLSAGDGAGTLCYLGNPRRVTDTIEEGTSSIWSETMWIYGWRAGTLKVLADDVTEADMLELMDAPDVQLWTDYDTTSASVMVSSSFTDDGDDPTITMIPEC